MSRHPNSPTSHHGRLQISLNLILIILERLPLGNIEVSKEHETKNGIPHGLVDENLSGDGGGFGSGEFGVKKSVEVVTGSSVNQEAEGSKTEGTHRIVGLAIIIDKILSEDVTYGEPGERSECLGEEGLRLKHCVISGPESAHIAEMKSNSC
mmetsp:Transcript_127/g.295  ORF Transcript_127/g.295 Transcript_127/m.295 type:complete len:152 (-) Transcript_127:123-578(-)